MGKPSWKRYRAYRAWVSRRSAELEALHVEHITLDGRKMGCREAAELEARKRIPEKVTSQCEGVFYYGAAVFLIMCIGAVVITPLYCLPMASLGDEYEASVLGMCIMEASVAFLSGAAALVSRLAPGFWFIKVEHGIEEGDGR